MAQLAEIAEGAATGSVAAAYADIRRVTGVPFFVFIYRVLATEPGRLERIWAELAPNLASATGLAARAELELPPWPEGLPRAARLPGVAAPPGTADMLAGFRRANAANVVALWALLDGVAGREPAPPGPAPATAAPVPPGLPMADLAALPASTLALLEEMSAPVAGGAAAEGAPLLIPSMFRCLAHDEALLAAVGGGLRPLLQSPAFRPAVDALAARGRSLAQTLPHPVTRLDDAPTRAVIERFLQAIPAMLLVGPAIAAALGTGES